MAGSFVAGGLDGRTRSLLMTLLVVFFVLPALAPALLVVFLLLLGALAAL